MEIDTKLIVITFVTITIGSVVRVLHENEKEKVKKKRVFLIYACSIAIGSLCYTLAFIFDKKDLLGLAGIIGGIISVDLINIIMDKGPKILGKWLDKKTKDTIDD